jgi:regulator of nucleoside diphosphate kinase
MNSKVPLPPIIVGTQDYCHLIKAAEPSRQQGKHHADFLLTELRRAVIAHPYDLPADVVSINSRVTYRLDDQPETQTRVLVHAGYVKWPSAELSVMTPLGTALLGLRVRDTMPFRTSDGQQHEVLVEDVGFRPLAGVVPYERVLASQSRPGTTAPPLVQTLPENSRDNLDRRLDAALEESFPASDPISIVIAP